MDTAERVVQWPDYVQIAVGDGLVAAAWLEHVHACFGVGEIFVHGVGEAIEEFGCCAEEKGDAGRKCPVSALLRQ